MNFAVRIINRIIFIRKKEELESKIPFTPIRPNEKSQESFHLFDDFSNNLEFGRLFSIFQGYAGIYPGGNGKEIGLFNG
jgi:hypothetical protein